MTDPNFLPLYAFHRRLGYDREASIRLALWCLDYEAPLFPERETP
jgi:hypothetical protein